MDWRRIWACLVLLSAIAVLPGQGAAAQTVTLDGDFIEGGLVKGRVAPGAKVRFADRDVTVGPNGRFLIGFHRDSPEEMTLDITFADGTEESIPLTIEPREYDIERIDGLPPKKVTPPDEVLARIRADAAQVYDARLRDTPEEWFESGWIWPVHGRISGVFGSQRILNGEPRQPHYGVDIAAPTGTPVKAPADGVVSLAHDDMYFSGGTLMIDHGHGLASAFLHMEDITVAVGDFVKKGDVIGTVGATGRATGPHLDWRINWFDHRLDATLLVPPGKLG